jgi:phenylalanyl-tRNA synthetase beta chain
VLGFELEAKWIEEKFTSLDFEISTKTKGSWTIIPPSFRFDIRLPADLIDVIGANFGKDASSIQVLMSLA